MRNLLLITVSHGHLSPYNHFTIVLYPLKLLSPVFPIEVTPVGQQMLFKVTFNLYQEQEDQQV